MARPVVGAGAGSYSTMQRNLLSLANVVSVAKYNPVAVKGLFSL